MASGKACIVATIVLGAGAVVAMGSGCELIASVEREKIVAPDAGGHGGQGGTGATTSTGMAGMGGTGGQGIGGQGTGGQGTGGQGIGGQGIGGAASSCVDPAIDCPTPSECQEAICSNGACATQDAADGTPIADDGNECTDDACNNGAPAHLPKAAGTTCGSSAQSCVAGIEDMPDTCDSNGNCAANTTACAPYTCDVDACKTTCATSGDCTSGSYCAGGSCNPTKVNGATCAGNNECQSGNCIDSVCCNTTCTGNCVACNLAGTEGTCTNVPVGTADTCPGNKACSALGECKASDGQPCNANSDCASDNCVSGSCTSGG